ncbi:MAG: FkbM family methyltransferase [Bacteroidia bacterium]
MKSTIVRTIQRIFLFSLMEKMLVRIILLFPSSRFIRKLAPQNHEYKGETIRVCKRRNINYFLDIRDYQSWLIYYDCDYDSSFDILKHVKSGLTIIDVGGNIGQTAMTMAQKTGAAGKVISFEPHPSTVEKFRKNLSLNPQISNVIVENFGLGDQENTAEMFVECTTNSGGNRIAGSSEKSNGTPVKITTLDRYLDMHGIEKVDLVKIDVEGYEMNVLNGMTKILQRQRPLLYLEIDDNNLKKQGHSAQEMIDLLHRLNYEILEVSAYKTITVPADIPHSCRDIFCRPK